MGIQYEPFEEVKDAVWEHHGVYFRNVLIYSCIWSVRGTGKKIYGNGA